MERRVTAGRFSVTLMMGAPGAGKGTQAVFACEALGVPHVATGDLLRDHQRHGTALGTTARVYMDRGDLVPDDLVMGMLIERLQQSDAANGALLDGFPRTLSQARALDDGLGAHGGGVRAVVYLDVPTDVLVRRLSGRRACARLRGDLQRRPPATCLPMARVRRVAISWLTVGTTSRASSHTACRSIFRRRPRSSSTTVTRGWCARSTGADQSTRSSPACSRR